PAPRRRGAVWAGGRGKAARVRGGPPAGGYLATHHRPGAPLSRDPQRPAGGPLLQLSAGGDGKRPRLSVEPGLEEPRRPRGRLRRLVQEPVSHREVSPALLSK